MTRRLEFTLSDELWDRLNEARGFEPRASFVKRALESALSQDEAGESRAYSEQTRDGASASSRAPVEKEPAVGVPLPKIAPRRTR